MAATRLYVIVAREAPVAVVFRRGPSKQVELLRWDLETDAVSPGQWLKGRIYERRCDLSPSGELLVYFASKQETKLRTWTAISRPPFLTALAMWPKGDAWGGGGLFRSSRELLLNHRAGEMALAEDFRKPPLRVSPLGERPGWGEDEPIHSARLSRGGWTTPERWPEATWPSNSNPMAVTFEPPVEFVREVGPAGARVTLRLSIDGLMERGGPSYVNRYELVNDAVVVRDLGRADWADAAPDGGILLAQDGRLLRLMPDRDGSWSQTEPRLIADLSSHVFEARVAPSEALLWPESLLGAPS